MSDWFVRLLEREGFVPTRRFFNQGVPGPEPRILDPDFANLQYIALSSLLITASGLEFSHQSMCCTGVLPIFPLLSFLCTFCKHRTEHHSDLHPTYNHLANHVFPWFVWGRYATTCELLYMDRAHSPIQYFDDPPLMKMLFSVWLS